MTGCVLVVARSQASSEAVFYLCYPQRMTTTLTQAFSDLQAADRALASADVDLGHAQSDVDTTTSLLAAQTTTLGQKTTDDKSAADAYNTQVDAVVAALQASKASR